jgi:hypothetical protein
MKKPQIRKMCRTCGMMKLPRSFSRNKRQRDGVKSQCKACVNQQARAERANEKPDSLGWPTDLGQVFEDHPRAPISRHPPRHIPYFKSVILTRSSMANMDGPGLPTGGLRLK